ncbi:MAG: hypothetical protein ACYC4U_08275 [Pirellulaceae bacterium]
MSRECGFLLAIVLLTGNILCGQEPSPPPAPSDGPTVRDSDPASEPAGETTSAVEEQGSAAEAGAVNPPRTPAGQAATAVESSLPQEHIIYLPFENLREVFEKQDSSVVLPYAQFLEMWNRLIQPEKTSTPLPVHGVITRAEYVGSVQGERVRLEVSLDLEVLAADWARIPMTFGDAAIGSVQSSDGAVLVRGLGDGQYELLVKGQGKHQVTLSLVIGVKSAAGGRSITVQCPPVGISNLELTIPEEDLAVQVTPRRALELRDDIPDTTRVIATLGSTDQFSVSWQPKSGGTDQTAGLANVTDTIAVDVGDGVVHTHAVFDYEILRGSLPQLTVEVSAEQRLLDVQVPGLRDWQSETVDDRQRVTVRLHAPAAEKARLELRMETAIAADAFQVGQVRAVDAARETGILAVRGADDVGLEFVLRESIARVDAADAPEALQRPHSTYYKFFTPDHKLKVVASQLKPRITVDSRVRILLDKTRLTTQAEFRCQVSRSGVFSLAFRFPAGFQVDDVRADSMERFEVTPAENGQTLTVYFAKKLLGEVTVTVIAGQARDKPAGEVSLPLPEPLGAIREQGLVAVIAPESLEVKTDMVQLQAARAATPAELAARGFQSEVPAGSALAAAFSFVTRPVQIVQTITERPRRTAVVVSTLVHVKEDVVQVATTLQYQIEFAGTDTFRIVVPAEASERLQVQGDGIKERRRADRTNEDGSVEWTIVLHSEALGSCTFTAIYDQRISISEQGTPWEFQPIRTLGVDRQTGEIAIQKDRALAIEAAPSGLEEIDPRELLQQNESLTPHLTYRYFQDPVRLALAITKHELQDVVRTVIHRAYIEAVITKEGPITIRARYDLKSSERQRLAVRLRDPRILGFTVAGQTVAPEKGPADAGGDTQDKTFLINVARATTSDEPFQIAMLFETPLRQADLGVTDVLYLPLPRFDEGVKCQQVYVRIWVPKEYRLVGDPDGFTSHIHVGLLDSRTITRAPDNPDSWFPQNASSFDFQVGGTTYLFSTLEGPADLRVGYWRISVMTLMASLMVLVLGLALVPFSVETKVFAVFAVAFGLLFAGLFSPTTVNSWLLSARLGVAGVVAVWLVVWLLYLRRTIPFRTAAQPPSVAAPAIEIVEEVHKTDMPENAAGDPGRDSDGR